MKPRRSVQVKRIVFSLIPALFLLSVSTVVLEIFERRGEIETVRMDDAVMGSPEYFLGIKEDKDGNLVFHNNSPGVEHVFPKHKPAGQMRVFLTGESFAQGAPYTIASNPISPKYGDITNWMRALLEMRYPSLRFDVVNASVGGINSTGVVAIARMLIPLQPDIIIVATGNNDGFVQSPLEEFMQQWIIFRAMKKALLKNPEPMDRMKSDRLRNEVKNQSERIVAINDSIQRQFKKNFSKIVEATQKNKIDLILSTLPINMKLDRQYPAFPWPKFPEDEYIVKGKQSLAQGRPEEAIDLFAKSASRYYSSLLVGETLEAMGKYDAAMNVYTEIVELKPMSRIHPYLNTFIRRFAGRNDHVYLADAERAVLSHGPHGMPDPDLWWDNCHMKWRGYLIVAKEIVRTMIENRLIHGGAGEPLPEPTAEEMIEKYHWCMLAESKD